MSAVYESEKVLAEYLMFHFGSRDEVLPEGVEWPVGMVGALGFAERTARWFSAGEVARGLDLGCAVGGSSWEMARGCREVVGIDFSRAFIDAAECLRRGEGISYGRMEEGNVRTGLVARVGEEVAGLAERIRFEVGDAMDLRGDLGDFDRVHAANLICRLPEPERLLGRLAGLVRAGGELVLATPCTWLEEFTARGNWPEGGTFDWLEERLGRDFVLERRGEEAFLIRETARKFQWSSSMVMLWRRKG